MQNKDMMGIQNDLPDELGNVMIIISQCLQSKAFYLHLRNLIICSTLFLLTVVYIYIYILRNITNSGPFLTTALLTLSVVLLSCGITL